MRSLSTAAIAAFAGQETERVVIALLTFDHSFLHDPLRFSTDPTVRVDDEVLTYKTTSRGEDYYFIPMEIRIPDEGDDTPTTADIRVANPGQELTTLLRSVTTPPTVTLELVLDSDLDEVIVSFPTFNLTNVQFDAASISLGLSVNKRDVEGYPGLRFTPGAFPSLFS